MSSNRIPSTNSRLTGLRHLVVPALLLASTLSSAAISFVQRNSALPQTPQTTVTVAYAAAQVAGDTNVVAVGWSDITTSVVSVTDTAGNIYTPVIGPTRQSGAQSQSIYVANNVKAAAANANSVTVTFSAAANYPNVRVLSYRGLDPAAPVEAAVGAGGSGTTSNSGSLTTTNANDLLFAANCVSSTTKAAGTGFTSRIITSPDSDIAEDRIVTAAGTYSATATMSSGAWVMQLVALKAAGSLPVAATPTFSPVAGTYTSPQSVSLLDTTAGAAIYYTTDGVTTPTTSSPVFNPAQPIQVTTQTTIKAMAAASGFANSPVATGTFTIQVPAAATPTFSPAPNTYSSPQSVSLLDATSGATIYYTTDGVTNPTTSSAVFNPASPIPVSANMTIKAMAAASGFANSAVATGVYTIQLPTTATPTFSPVAGTYNSTQSVSLLDSTSNSTIYYTTDGVTNPTTSSAVFNPAQPIPVNATTTIKAMATANNLANSAVATGVFTLQTATPTFNPVPATVCFGAVCESVGCNLRRDDLLHYGWRHESDDVLDGLQSGSADPGKREYDDQGDGGSERLLQQRGGDWGIYDPASGGGNADLQSGARPLLHNSVGEFAGHNFERDDLFHHGWSHQSDYLIDGLQQHANPGEFEHYDQGDGGS